MADRIVLVFQAVLASKWASGQALSPLAWCLFHGPSPAFDL